jgi:hypothetical protein
MKEALFIRDFSKEQSQENRDKLAKNIRSQRSELFSEEKNRQTELGTAQEIDFDRTVHIEKFQEQIQEKIKQLEELQNRIKEISESLPQRMFKFFEMKKLKANFESGEINLKKLKEKVTILQTHSVNSRADMERLSFDNFDTKLKDCSILVQNFYKEQGEKWAASEFTTKDIEKYFTEDHLASLSQEDYILLMRRFPGEMVTHVTRQGIRDHIGMMYHTAGEDEYSDGFTRILDDGRLRSPLGAFLTEGAKEKKIYEYLLKYFPPQNYPDKASFLEAVKNHINPDYQSGTPGSYSDKMAVHFAAEEVADEFYGSEKGNEIFFAFPANFIASQYYFSGRLNDSSGGAWNDQWVWANEEKGLNINSGIVFIPKNAKVDRNTGSRYELDGNNKPIVNSEFVNIIKEVVSDNEFNNYYKKIREVYLHSHGDSGKLKTLWNEFGSKFNIFDERIENILIDCNLLLDFYVYAGDHERFQSEIESALKRYGIYFKEAKNPVYSSEYWEEYFSKHSNIRSSKIIYYEGSDPTEAFRNWKIENKLIKKSNDYSMGFPERSVDQDSCQATSGLDRFSNILLEVAQKVVEDNFQQRIIHKTI